MSKQVFANNPSSFYWLHSVGSAYLQNPCQWPLCFWHQAKLWLGLQGNDQRQANKTIDGTAFELQKQSKGTKILYIGKERGSKHLSPIICHAHPCLVLPYYTSPFLTFHDCICVTSERLNSSLRWLSQSLLLAHLFSIPSIFVCLSSERMSTFQNQQSEWLCLSYLILHWDAAQLQAMQFSIWLIFSTIILLHVFFKEDILCFLNLFVSINISLTTGHLLLARQYWPGLLRQITSLNTNWQQLSAFMDADMAKRTC